MVAPLHELGCLGCSSAGARGPDRWLICGCADAQIESIVNTFVPPNDRAALYQAASTVINSIPGGAGALGGVAGGSRGPTLAPVNGNSTSASSQGAFCTSCGPSPAGSPPSSAPATNSKSPTPAPSGGSKGAFDTSPVASTPPATQG